MTDQAAFIAGQWQSGSGAPFFAEDPTTGAVVWQGPSASASDVARAVSSARAAWDGWADRPIEDRIAVVQAYAQALQDAEGALIDAICTDTGKPRWEAKAELGAMVRKVALSVDAHQLRTGRRQQPMPDGSQMVVQHRPHGVLAVMGPFNFPGHLPNGHIVPAWIAGNTVVFKPSELAPLTAEALIRCAEKAGIPPGVINLVQGGRETGAALVADTGVDGLLFTGSADTGRGLHRLFADHPEKILALEMGGNNPLVLWPPVDVDLAARMAILSAYATAGQRCTCARRLVVPAGPVGQALLDRIAVGIDVMRVGPPSLDPPAFMGPVISNRTADDLLAAQADLLARGGVALRAMARPVAGRPFLTAGLIDVTAIKERLDVERFGPLLQVVRVADFDAALAEANNTRFGLAAGLVGGGADLWDRFSRRVRAGVINWNRPTTGAPSDAPFGGIGASGNHRPAAYYTADHCAYPVTSVQADQPGLPDPLPPGLG